MDAIQNRAVVQSAYAAFLRGDTAGVLALVDDHVVWEAVTGASANVPTAGRRVGKAAVAEFFRTLGETITFERFEPTEFIAEGDRVVALGAYRGGPKGSASRFESQWAMIFRLRDGRIVDFQEFCDTASINAAFEPVRA